MEIQRFGVTTTVFVDAADAGEAALIIERDFAGRFESEVVSVTAHTGSATSARCPACGSERIEHHEDIVARRHFRKVRADGTLVFDGFTDSDDDGLRPRLWVRRLLDRMGSARPGGGVRVSTLCYWCHEELPPLPEDSSYVDEINHYIHDECRDERDEKNRCMEEMRAGIADGSIDSIPGDIRTFVLDRIKSQGFSRRAPVPLRRRLRLSGLRDALVRRKR